jgi:hypothetical protein
MKKEFNIQSTIAIGSLILMAAATRFLPHPANFTAIGAMALFGTARLQDKRLAFILPIAAMLLSDLFIPYGFNPSVYLSFALIAILGLSLRNTKKVLPIAGASVASSLIFYIITNFAVWMGDNGVMYAKSIDGLWMSYTAAIPFFWNGMAGDLFFTGVMFGSYELVNKFALAKA